MKGFNHVELAGNVVRDPQIRYTGNNEAVAQFTLAVNSPVRGQDGQWSDQATYIPCVVWGKLAESVEHYVKKGHPIVCHGKIQIQNWDDKNTGEKKSITRVKVDEIVFANGGPQAPSQNAAPVQNQPAPQSYRQPAPPQAQPAPQPPVSEVEMDIPF